MAIWDVFKKIDQEHKKQKQKKRAKRHNSPQTQSSAPPQEAPPPLQAQPTENEEPQQTEPQESLASQQQPEPNDQTDPQTRLHHLKLELEELQNKHPKLVQARDTLQKKVDQINREFEDLKDQNEPGINARNAATSRYLEEGNQYEYRWYEGDHQERTFVGKPGEFADFKGSLAKPYHEKSRRLLEKGNQTTIELCHMIGRVGDVEDRLHQIKKEITELDSQKSTEDAERRRQVELETSEQKHEEKAARLEAQIQQLQDQLHALKADQQHANQRQQEAEAERQRQQAELDRNRRNEQYQEESARVRREIALEVDATADPDATDEEKQAEVERCLRLWEAANPPPN